MYACLAVTCHLHFWQNDRDFLRATVVTRGWNGYRNKSQHRKSTLEKKILPPFQQGFELATFQSRVRCSNHWAIPAPAVLRLAYESCTTLQWRFLHWRAAFMWLLITVWWHYLWVGVASRFLSHSVTTDASLTYGDVLLLLVAFIYSVSLCCRADSLRCFRVWFLIVTVAF